MLLMTEWLSQSNRLGSHGVVEYRTNALMHPLPVFEWYVQQGKRDYRKVKLRCLLLLRARPALTIPSYTGEDVTRELSRLQLGLAHETLS